MIAFRHTRNISARVPRSLFATQFRSCTTFPQVPSNDAPLFTLARQGEYSLPDLSCRREGSGYRADSSTITSLYNVAMNGVVRRDQKIFTARCFSSDREQSAEAKNKIAVEKSPPDEINIPGAEKGGRKLAIIFTCTQCDTRSAKQFTEKAYKQGVVIATCPGCQNKHLIADNLGFFSDEEEGWTIEKAMARLGENVKVATDDNVLELSVEDLFSKDAIEQAVRSASEIPEADEDKNSK